MYPQPTNIQGKAFKVALIVVGRSFSADKNVCHRLSPLIGEELVQSFNGQKVSS